MKSLGDRMKEFYENRTRYYLPRRTYSIIRIDGKAFHTYTKGLNRPFDLRFVEDMDKTAIYLCKKIQGAKFAYVQSDEISLLLTDFDNLTTNAWFEGEIRKICSISASLATAKFNQLRFLGEFNDTGGIDSNIKIAAFDSRVFTIPHNIEVENYFIWRQQDATRNSIAAVAQSQYSHKELHKKNTSRMQEMIFKKGINWNDYNSKLKRGRIILKNPETFQWESLAPPVFTQDRAFLKALIPIQYNENRNDPDSK